MRAGVDGSGRKALALLFGVGVDARLAVGIGEAASAGCSAHGMVVPEPSKVAAESESGGNHTPPTFRHPGGAIGPVAAGERPKVFPEVLAHPLLSSHGVSSRSGEFDA